MPQLQQLLEMQQQGMEVRALRERPTLKAEHRWLYDAYRMLSSSRQLGAMGEFYIPLTEYRAYFDIVELDNVEQRTFLLSVLSQVDALLLHERYQENAK